MKLFRFLPLSFLVILFMGCHSKVEPLSGAVPADVVLVADKSDNSKKVFRSTKPFSVYKAVRLLPVTLGKDVDDKEEGVVLGKSFREQIIASIGLPETTGPGAGVLDVRVSITGLKGNIAILNVAPQTQVLGNGYGFVASEIYATDSADGKTVAGYANTKNTERLSLEKMTTWGSAEVGIKEMTKDFVELIKSK